MPPVNRLLAVAISLAAFLAALLVTSPAAQAQATYRWTDKDGRVNYADQPPPADAKDLQRQNLGPANLVDTGGPSYSARKAAQDYPVTLYTSVDCAAECELARKFLKQRAIPYREKTVKSLDDASAFKKATGGEELVVPTILVGSAANKGFESGSWHKLLEAAGYPLTGKFDPAQR